MTLEELQPQASVRGVVPDALVTVVNVQWFGSEALELTYKTPSGKVANELLYRHDEPRLELVEQRYSWSFDGDGALFPPPFLAAEVKYTKRCRLGQLLSGLTRHFLLMTATPTKEGGCSSNAGLSPLK